MRHQTKFSRHPLTGLLPILLCILAVGGILVVAQPAFAAIDGGTVEDSLCMQRIFMGPPPATMTSANKLNCTANDISLALATSVSPTTCFEGSTIDLTATFEVVVTANARYDAGFFFRLDGGSNARGDGVTASGSCSLSWLYPRDLDGDTCGDLNAGTYSVTFFIPKVKCVSAPGTKLLHLPNCTSWHSNQGTACTAPTSATDSDVFDFHPDTKSKCKCDDTFTVPVTVEDAQLQVVKSASPSSVPETGGEVTYSVDVTNLASATSVTINTIIDDVYGNLGTDTPSQTDNTCPSLIGTLLGPGGKTSCSFKALVSGNTGSQITDTVEVCGSGSGGQEAQICGHDDATVTITDVSNTPSLSKTAKSAANCQMDVTYQVVTSNTSTVDSLTVNSLTDNKFGNITTTHDAGGGFEKVVSTGCVTGGTIDPIKNYTCEFVGQITSSNCKFTHTNTVTAGTTDGDGISSSPTGTATVTNLDPTFSNP